ncbi:hypothetical protein FACS189472_05810 [Alphaproteobacteria bacterium]|nr:hypothetical protein FACS189472_05810 [Alphaproteobacteria bacterium]
MCSFKKVLCVSISLCGFLTLSQVFGVDGGKAVDINGDDIFPWSDGYQGGYYAHSGDSWSRWRNWRTIMMRNGKFYSKSESDPPAATDKASWVNYGRIEGADAGRPSPPDRMCGHFPGFTTGDFYAEANADAVWINDGTIKSENGNFYARSNNNKSFWKNTVNGKIRARLAGGVFCAYSAGDAKWANAGAIDTQEGLGVFNAESTAGNAFWENGAEHNANACIMNVTNGSFRASAPTGDATWTNEGTIKTRDGGHIYLEAKGAKNVLWTNLGTISQDPGTVTSHIGAIDIGASQDARVIAKNHGTIAMESGSPLSLESDLYNTGTIRLNERGGGRLYFNGHTIYNVCDKEPDLMCDDKANGNRDKYGVGPILKGITAEAEVNKVKDAWRSSQDYYKNAAYHDLVDDDNISDFIAIDKDRSIALPGAIFPKYHHDTTERRHVDFCVQDYPKQVDLRGVTNGKDLYKALVKSGNIVEGHFETSVTPFGIGMENITALDNTERFAKNDGYIDFQDQAKYNEYVFPLDISGNNRWHKKAIYMGEENDKTKAPNDTDTSPVRKKITVNLVDTKATSDGIAKILSDAVSGSDTSGSDSYSDGNSIAAISGGRFASSVNSAFRNLDINRRTTVSADDNLTKSLKDTYDLVKTANDAINKPFPTLNRPAVFQRLITAKSALSAASGNLGDPKFADIQYSGLKNNIEEYLEIVNDLDEQLKRDLAFNGSIHSILGYISQHDSKVSDVKSSFDAFGISKNSVFKGVDPSKEALKPLAQTYESVTTLNNAINGTGDIGENILTLKSLEAGVALRTLQRAHEKFDQNVQVTGELEEGQRNDIKNKVNTYLAAAKEFKDDPASARKKAECTSSFPAVKAAFGLISPILEEAHPTEEHPFRASDYLRYRPKGISEDGFLVLIREYESAHRLNAAITANDAANVFGKKDIVGIGMGLENLNQLHEKVNAEDLALDIGSIENKIREYREAAEKLQNSQNPQNKVLCNQAFMHVKSSLDTLCMPWNTEKNFNSLKTAHDKVEEANNIVRTANSATELTQARDALNIAKIALNDINVDGSKTYSTGDKSYLDNVNDLKNTIDAYDIEISKLNDEGLPAYRASSYMNYDANDTNGKKGDWIGHVEDVSKRVVLNQCAADYTDTYTNGGHNTTDKKKGVDYMYYTGDHSWYNGVFNVDGGGDVIDDVTKLPKYIKRDNEGKITKYGTVAEFSPDGAIYGGDINIKNGAQLIWHGGAKDPSNKPNIVLSGESDLTFDLPVGENSVFSVYGTISCTDGDMASGRKCNNTVHLNNGTVYLKGDCSGFMGDIYVADGAKFVAKSRRNGVAVGAGDAPGAPGSGIDVPWLGDYVYKGKMFSGTIHMANATDITNVKTSEHVKHLRVPKGILQIDDTKSDSGEVGKKRIGKLTIDGTDGGKNATSSGAKGFVNFANAQLGYDENGNPTGETTEVLGENSVLKIREWTKIHKLVVDKGTLRIKPTKDYDGTGYTVEIDEASFGSLLETRNHSNKYDGEPGSLEFKEDPATSLDLIRANRLTLIDTMDWNLDIMPQPGHAPVATNSYFAEKSPSDNLSLGQLVYSNHAININELNIEQSPFSPTSDGSLVEKYVFELLRYDIGNGANQTPLAHLIPVSNVTTKYKCITNTGPEGNIVANGLNLFTAATPPEDVDYYSIAIERDSMNPGTVRDFLVLTLKKAGENDANDGDGDDGDDVEVPSLELMHVNNISKIYDAICGTSDHVAYREVSLGKCSFWNKSFYLSSDIKTHEASKLCSNGFATIFGCDGELQNMDNGYAYIPTIFAGYNTASLEHTDQEGRYKGAIIGSKVSFVDNSGNSKDGYFKLDMIGSYELMNTKNNTYNIDLRSHLLSVGVKVLRSIPLDDNFTLIPSFGGDCSFIRTEDKKLKDEDILNNKDFYSINPFAGLHLQIGDEEQGGVIGVKFNKTLGGELRGRIEEENRKVSYVGKAKSNVEYNASIHKRDKDCDVSLGVSKTTGATNGFSVKLDAAVRI